MSLFSQGDPLSPKRRIVALSFLLFVLFATLVSRYFFIQVIQHEKWEEMARKQHFYVVTDPFERGSFFTRSKVFGEKKIVYDLEKFHLYIDPIALPEKHHEEISAALKYFLSKTEQAALSSHLKRKSRSREVARWIEQDEKEEVLEWWYPFAARHKIPKNALYFLPRFQRSYPFKSLLGQVIHTVKERRDEQTNQALPTGGLELYFHHHLKGSEGKRLLKRSPRHAFEIGDILYPPQDGKDIHLTIDHVLQTICEEEIERGVKFARAEMGWAVMMEPLTGKILALAQYPFFDPTKYASYYNDPQKTKYTKVKSVTDAQEPGSVVKPMNLAIALQANKELIEQKKVPLFDPEAKYATSNGIFPGRHKELTDVTRHNYLNFDMALAKSSNVYCARQVEKIIHHMGEKWYRDQLIQRFGLGIRTGIELPAESSGLIPRIGKKHPNGTLEWSKSTPPSLAMGHNMLTTGIQIVRAWAVFANGGYLVKPTLIEKITDKKGNVWLTPKKESITKVFDQDIMDRVVQGLRYVTTPFGAGSRGNVWGYTEVGKTGTANKIENGRYTEEHSLASYVGFTPLKNPEFVLYVAIDDPKQGFVGGVGKNHMGSVAAAPIFSRIARRALHYLEVEEDDPHGYPVMDPQYDPELADWLKESEYLRKIYDSWNK